MNDDNNIGEVLDSMVRITDELNACKKVMMENSDKEKYISGYKENNRITTDEAFLEMAGRIPGDKPGRCKLVVAVGGNERNIAHFHVFRSEEDFRAWRNGACLYFAKNKYYDHSNNTETLTRDELKDLVGILKKPYRRNQSITNWQQLVYLWNDNNDEYEILDDTPMPDYDYKTITRYKEKDISGDDRN